jgi:lipopolysaccharide/colanic/teichoic acid biosynthesis glycosyltransferase
MMLPSAWTDRVLAAAGLILCSPVMAAAAVAILLDDGAPVFYRQTRVGRGGRRFRLLKFRSMRTAPGPAITFSGDPRISRVGRFLRKYKIDELPQLWNVIKGDMSLIGPRPEVPEYVQPDNPAWMPVLRLRPGITDLASLIFRNEEEVLAQSPDPDRCYRDVILPNKLRLNCEYQGLRSMSSDCKLLCLTVWYSLRPRRFDPDRIRDAFLVKQ